MPFVARHFAMIAPPTPGHLNPLQVLGKELVAGGHRVTVVHLGGAARFVMASTIGFAALGDAADASATLGSYLAKLADPTGLRGLMRMIQAAATSTECLLRHAPTVMERIGIDAVIADAAEPAGPLIARRMGVPHVIAVTGLPLLREPDVPPPFVGWSYRPTALGRFRNGGGYLVSDILLRPMGRILKRYRQAWGLEGSGDEHRLQVAQCPRGLDFPRTNLPPRFIYGSPWRDPATEPPDLPDDGRLLIFCSLGTLQGSRRDLFATMASACAAMGGRAVIGHGGGLTEAEQRNLPGDPLVRAFWPQEAVMRRCAAAVLHGGFNTVLDALAAGLPIVALPIAFEQPGTAARLVRLGVARSLSPRQISVRSVAAALREVINRPEYRRAASRLAREMAAAGGAPQAAAAINAALANT